LSLFLNQQACADLLGVCVRTVRHWDAGRNRVPWSAVKLLRLLRGGDLGALEPAWQGYRLDGNTIWTPEGHAFRAGEMAWWSLVVRRAQAFSRRYDRERATVRPSAVDALPAAVAAPDGGAYRVAREDRTRDGLTGPRGLGPAASDDRPLAEPALLLAGAAGSPAAAAQAAGAGTGLVFLKTSGTRGGGDGR